MLKKFLLVLFVSLVYMAISPFAVYADVPKDTLYINNLNQRFENGDVAERLAVIDVYIDSVGVTSNEFLKFITFEATAFDFSKQQKARVFDTASTKLKDSRILLLLNFFKDRTYIPVVKQWYSKGDKRYKFAYESLMFEYGDKEICDLWEGALKSCSRSTKFLPVVIGQIFPVICGRFPDRRFCDLVLDFIVDHQNQYFVSKDFSGVREYNDVVYFLSFFLVDRLKGFPDAFIFNKFERSNGDERYVSFSKADKDIIIKWCRAHRRDYEFEE